MILAVRTAAVRMERNDAVSVLIEEMIAAGHAEIAAGFQKAGDRAGPWEKLQFSFSVRRWSP